MMLALLHNPIKLCGFAVIFPRPHNPKTLCVLRSSVVQRFSLQLVELCFKGFVRSAIAHENIDTMRRVFVAVMAGWLFAGAAWAQPAHELWSLKLTGEGGIQSFARGGPLIWIQQQGVVFLSPERLLIYQVNRLAEPAPLAKRGASGGAGNFHLIARIMDAHTGREINRMGFVTSADYSAVLPTHDGRFIVRAGKIMGLYSADLTLLAARNLPPGQSPVDYWQVQVTPSGRQVVAAHQQLSVDPEYPLDASREKSQADLEFMDADTFAPIRKMHLPHYAPVWAPHEQFLLTTTPGKPLAETGTALGKMDFEGHWKRLQPPWMDKRSRCVYNFDLLQHDLMVARGCNELTVFQQSGEKMMEISAGSRHSFESVARSDHILAVEIEELVAPAGSPAGIEPGHIDVYDLNSREQVMSVKLETKAVYYAVSKDGLLAVVDGGELKVYSAAP